MTGDMRIEYQPLSKLLKAPRNPKKHDEQAMDASIARFGFNDAPTIDERTGRLVEGHGRIEALERRRRAGEPPPDRITAQPDGEWMVPITRGVRFESDQEAEAYLLGHNLIGMGAGHDDAMLAEILKEHEGALDGIGLDSDEVAKIIAQNTPAEAEESDDDAVPEPPKVATVRPGELWVLGDHRLLCGDASLPDVLTRLMMGLFAALFSTDPPYGVAYGVETGSKGKYDAIENDENNGPALQAFLERVFGEAKPHLAATAAWYLWHAQLSQGHFAAAAAAAADILIHRQIIWVKPSLVLGHGDFHWRHELCFYGWQQGNRSPWYGDRAQTTVWEVGRENDKIHPTQKPVELFLRPMNYNTRRGEVCLEPFCGSGSQIIAAERAERRCFATEIDPRYCDVIIERWERISGKKAVRG